MELNKNNRVIFTENPHRYTLLNEDFSTRELSGITAIIKKCICPNLYKDVDEATLAKAAVHGTACHKRCESFDNGKLVPTEDGGWAYKESGLVLGEDDGLAELKAYVELVKENDIMVAESEYLVSDNENFASSIDKVAIASDCMVDIIDLKFTYAYHEESVMWQTSFYADMLEAQTGVKVNKLYCIHIHKYKNGEVKSALHELKRVPTEYLEEAKRCYLAGEEFANPLARIERDMEADEGKQAEWRDTLKTAAEWEKKKKAVMEEMKKMVQEVPNTAKMKGVFFTVSQSAESHSIVLDEEKLKEEMPEVWKKYCTKVKKVAGRVTVSFNKK